MAAVAAVIAVLGALPGSVTAGPATGRVREFFGGVNHVITDPTPDRRLEDRLSAMRALVTGLIDFREAARIALGAEWTARTPAQQDEFVALFADLLRSSVFGAVGSRARFTNGLTVTYLGERAEHGGITVVTTILARSGNEITVGYRMTSREGAWKVYDVVLDGVSLVENYRAQFTKVIQRSSYAGLVDEMRVRLVDLNHGTAVASLSGPAAVPVAASGIGGPVPSLPSTEDIGTVAVAEDTAPLPSVGGGPAATTEPVDARAVASEPTDADSVDRQPVKTDTAERDRALGRLAAAESVVDRVLEQKAGKVASARPAVPLRLAARAASSTPSAPAPIRPSVDTRRVPDPTFWVQVGAFRTDEAAIKVVNALGDEQVALLQLPDAPLLRVMVGPFANRQAAASKLREIRTRGLDGFVAELAF
jgi:phospholipid transport system substrate-binding protein